ncbi:peptidase C39 [Acrocarpospora phusangensis]|uniref:Peptidase C39 n=1 Tax=Acrocarpospora phusangensis TaxID=1070424 RepID=A0A919QHZ2_9ACTN|nr:peptidase domain-containing ABC transporter [Acrocarpospora phusangensis]GIH27750.1 peptidase C39 [Acrocarpospora phusangensis]
MRTSDRPRRAPVVLQSTRFDCGPACLASVLAAFGRPVPIADIRESLDPGRDGISALELRDEARRHGLDCRGRQLEPNAEALARLPLPFVAHWESDHYVVVTRVRNDGVELMDPAIGRRRLDHAEFLSSTTGIVLTFGIADRPAPRPAAPSVLRSIIVPAVLANRGALTLLLLTSLLLLVAGLAVPVLTAQAVDAFVGGGGLSWLIAPVVGLFVAAGVFELARGMAAASMQYRIGGRLNTAFLDRFLAAPLQFVERRGPGELISRIMAADVLRDALATRLVGALLDAVVGVVYLVIVLVAAPLLGMVTLALGVAQLVALGALAVRGRRLRREELLADARSNSWLMEVANGLAWVKGAGAEHIVGAKAIQLHARRLAALHKAARNGAVAEAAASAVRIGGPLVLLITAGSSASTESPGRIVALAALAAAALGPLGAIATHLREFYEIGSVLDHLQDLAEAPVESPQGKSAVERLRGEVTVRGLSFRHTHRDPWTVDDLSFHVPPGTKLAIVGPSGSGKSTLAKLLVGLYKPTQGSVSVDGTDIAALDLPSVRRLMGVVWQDPLLFSGTVQENITLRVPDATPEAVREAARLAGIDTDIAAMPMGYETILGPSGDGLSGGQRQRLALARALVGRPAVLLLDEATSHLDTPTEALVERNLRATGVTRIVIAHRLSTVRDADLILVMSEGCVIEHGTHQDLIDYGGAYARMVGMQQVTTSEIVTDRTVPMRRPARRT